MPGIYDFNMRHCFWARLTLLYIAHNEHENIVEDDFKKDVETFNVLYFTSIVDKFFSWVSTILIIIGWCIQESWREKLSLLSPFLLTKLIVILLIWS